MPEQPNDNWIRDRFEQLSSQVTELRAELHDAVVSMYEHGRDDERDASAPPEAGPPAEPPPGARRKKHIWIVPVAWLLVWITWGWRHVRRQPAAAVTAATAVAVSAAAAVWIAGNAPGGDEDSAARLATPAPSHRSHGGYVVPSTPETTTGQLESPTSTADPDGDRRKGGGRGAGTVPAAIDGGNASPDRVPPTHGGDAQSASDDADAVGAGQAPARGSDGGGTGTPGQPGTGRSGDHPSGSDQPGDTVDTGGPPVASQPPRDAEPPAEPTIKPTSVPTQQPSDGGGKVWCLVRLDSGKTVRAHVEPYLCID